MTNELIQVFKLKEDNIKRKEPSSVSYDSITIFIAELGYLYCNFLVNYWVSSVWKIVNI